MLYIYIHVNTKQEHRYVRAGYIYPVLFSSKPTFIIRILKVSSALLTEIAK